MNFGIISLCFRIVNRLNVDAAMITMLQTRGQLQRQASGDCWSG